MPVQTYTAEAWERKKKQAAPGVERRRLARLVASAAGLPSQISAQNLGAGRKSRLQQGGGKSQWSKVTPPERHQAAVEDAAAPPPRAPPPQPKRKRVLSPYLNDAARAAARDSDEEE